jgi:anti-anti-sigma regulatory factor
MESNYLSVVPIILNGVETGILKLHGDLTMTNVKSIKETLYDLSYKYSRVNIEVSNVESVDLSFIQLLHSAKHTFRQLNKKISFDINLSPEIKSIIQDAGFNENLNLQS